MKQGSQPVCFAIEGGGHKGPPRKENMAQFFFNQENKRTLSLLWSVFEGTKGKQQLWGSPSVETNPNMNPGLTAHVGVGSLSQKLLCVKLHV